MVSIAAFQAVDPGPIPGHRSNYFAFRNLRLLENFALKKLLFLVCKSEIFFKVYFAII
jgi:hypothetical protein